MTPEEKARAERLAKKIKSFAQLNLQDFIYQLCCDLEAIAAAAVLARVYWVLEVSDTKPSINPNDRFRMAQLLVGAVRVGTVANKAMVSLESLIRDEATKEVQRIVEWQASLDGQRGPEGIDRFCERIATGLADITDATVRDFLQRMYDLSTDEPEAKP